MFGHRGRVSTFLLSLLAESTQQRYLKGFSSFCEWLAQRHIPWSQLPEEDQDWLLSEYILDCRDEDSPLQVLRDTVAACHKMFPRRRFLTANQVINGWAAQRPPQQAPPMPLELALALSVLFVGAGDSHVGVAILLSFCGLLRIGETLSLQRRHLVFGMGVLTLLLENTKTGQHQRVVLTNPSVIEFVLCHLSRHGIRGSDLVCQVSYSRFRTALTRGTAALGCSSVRFRSHSLRRGGATHLFHMNVPFHDLMFYGRWLSESSCRLYVKVGEAVLIQIRRSLRPLTASRVKLLASLGPRVFLLCPQHDKSRTTSSVKR